MSTRRLSLLGLVAGLLLVPGTPGEAAAQLMAGIGPAFPTGDFNSDVDARTGFMAFGRFGFSLLPLGGQVEVNYSRFSVADPQFAGTVPVARLAVAGSLAFHLIRVGGVRPYVLAGASFGRREIGEDTNLDTSWRLGLHLGGGVDIGSGLLKPFVELRYVSVDAPGAIRDTSIPILFGLRIL